MKTLEDRQAPIWRRGLALTRDFFESRLSEYL